jgi:hypothetical protein
MNITLRKASALQNSINDVIKHISFETEATLNEFQDPTAKLQETNVKFLQDLSKKEALYSALYEIRKAVSRVNALNSVDQLLADIAHLDKTIAMYTELSTKKAVEPIEVIKGRLDKIRGAKDDHYSLYGRNNVTSSVFEQADLDAFKVKLADLKRQKQNKQDRLLDINVRTEIALDAVTEATLITAGLL